MRCILFVGVLAIVGCQNITGPFQARRPVRVDDPTLSISEQERLARDRLAVPDETIVAGPVTGVVPMDRTTQGIYR